MQRIQTLCDRHMNQEVPEEVDADAGTVVLAVSKRATEIDLCYQCLTELNELLEAYFAIGRRPGRATPVAASAAPQRRATADGGVRQYKPGDEPNGPMLNGNPTWLCRAPGVECDRKDPDNPRGPFESLLATAIHESRAHGWRNDGKPSRAKTKPAAKATRRTRELADATT